MANPGRPGDAELAIDPDGLPRPLEGRDIVCVGFADWDAELKTNQHHLMGRLARRNRVLFVESLGLRQPQLVARDLSRIRRRLQRGLAPPRAVDGLHVLSPLVLPFHRYRAVRALNAALLPRIVARAARRLGMSKPVIWAYNPQAEVLIDALRPSRVIYHCVDHVAAQKGVDAESFEAAEASFARVADVVFASSAPLAERLSGFSDRVVVMPNVADTELFATALADGPVDPEMDALPRPRIAFTGAVVSTKLDFELVASIARARPDWSIVLVGPVGAGDPGTDASVLEAEPNVHLLGVRPYEQLPSVLRGADAALIPYALNDLTGSVFPMKVYEYLAAGLPVVSTPLPSLRELGGTVVAAADAASAVARLEELLAGDSRDLREERSRLALRHSWDKRLEEMAAAIEEHD